MAAGVDYAFALPQGGTALSAEALRNGIERALLVPMAGAASVPPSPALEEIWSANVTVGAGVNPVEGSAEHWTGVSDGTHRRPHARFGDLSDWRWELSPSVVVAPLTLRFERHEGGGDRTDLRIITPLMTIDHSTTVRRPR